MHARRHVRVVENGGDLLEGETQLAVKQDLLQPLQIRIVIAPVARVRAVDRREQPDLVIVVQRSHRHAGDLGDPADCISHGLPSFHDQRVPCRYVRCNDDSALTLTQREFPPSPV